MNKMTVLLAHGRNPDIPAGYWHETPTPGGRTVVVEDIQAARVVCQAYIRENDLGAGNWRGGLVRIGDAKVAEISFNGRVWWVSQ